MSEELHGRLREFLIEEINRKNERQCTRVALIHAPKGGREMPLKDWRREDEPEIFESLTLIEKLTAAIIEYTEHYADSFMTGKHRFVVTTHQHLAGKAATFAFHVTANTAAEDNTAIAAPGGATAVAMSEGSATQISLALMRTNQFMFEATLRALSNTNADLKDENTELRGEVRTLRNELDEARSTRMEREANLQWQGVKQQQRSEALRQFMQFLTIALARFTAGKPGAPSAEGKPGTSSALRILVAKFGENLRARPERLQALFGVLEQGEIAMLMEIIQLAAQEEQAEREAAAGAASASEQQAPAA